MRVYVSVREMVNECVCEKEREGRGVKERERERKSIMIKSRYENFIKIIGNSI